VKRSKLEELLGELDEQKFKRLGEFVISPYHNRNKQIIKLYNFFHKLYGKEHPIKISRPDIYSNLFPGKVFNTQKLELLLSEFKSLLIDFILMEKLKANSNIIKNDVLLEMFGSSSLKKNYESTLNEVRRLYKLDLNRNYQYYFYKFNAEFNDAIANILETMYGNTSLNFKLLEDNANFLFIEIKLELLILILRHKKDLRKNPVYKLWHEQSAIKYILSNIELIKKEHPIIFSLYLVTKLYTSKNSDKYYKELKLYLTENFNMFKTDVIKALFTELNNYNDDRLILNREKYTKEMFDIYKTLDQMKVYEKLTIIEGFDIINAIYLGLEQKERLWVNTFFNKNKHKIEPGFRNDLIHLAKANLAFEDGDYSVSLTELNDIGSNEFYFYLRIRLLRAKIYFEVNDIEAGRYIIDSFKHYIKRHKEKLGVAHDAIINFINYYGILLRLREQNHEKNFKQIIKELKSQHKIVSKPWLIDKFEKSYKQKPKA